jgi:Pyruvate/2-oxoacid:ferredoxin oxidoreductase delta subunit
MNILVDKIRYPLNKFFTSFQTMDNWKSLYIYFISGTGNARASAGWIADEANSLGLRTVVQQIDRLESIVFPQPGEKALIGFAFPTHGFNTAPLMLKFLAGFPAHLGNKVFLLNTRAGMKLYKIFMPGLSGVALILPAFILWLKGYQCIGFRPVDMPSNWISLHPGIRKKVAESIFIRCEKIVRNFAGKILNGKNVYRGLLSLPVDLLLSPIALAYYFGGRFFLAKTFIANSKCNNCGICIKECPTASIRLVENRPYWKLTCESCMRCMNNCPQRAIESAHGMAVIFWIIYSTANAQLIIMLVNLLHFEPEAWWWKITSFIIGIGGMILITTLLYRILHSAMHFKPISSIVRFTSLTTYHFWRRFESFKRSKKTEQSVNHGA